MWPNLWLWPDLLEKFLKIRQRLKQKLQTHLSLDFPLSRTSLRVAFSAPVRPCPKRRSSAGILALS